MREARAKGVWTLELAKVYKNNNNTFCEQQWWAVGVAAIVVKVDHFAESFSSLDSGFILFLGLQSGSSFSSTCFPSPIRELMMGFSLSDGSVLIDRTTLSTSCTSFLGAGSNSSLRLTCSTLASSTRGACDWCDGTEDEPGESLVDLFRCDDFSRYRLSCTCQAMEVTATWKRENVFYHWIQANS